MNKAQEFLESLNEADNKKVDKMTTQISDMRKKLLKMKGEFSMAVGNDNLSVSKKAFKMVDKIAGDMDSLVKMLDKEF